MRLSVGHSNAIIWFYFFILVSVLLATPNLSSKPSGQSPTPESCNDCVHRSVPTFYRDILPILQHHCQLCHSRRSGIAPMAFETYAETFRYAKLIHTVTADRSMPPSFAIPEVGHVANDPSLTSEQVGILQAWADAKAPAGNLEDTPLLAQPSSGWTIGQPSLVLQTSDATQFPVQREIKYVYEIVPTHFTKGRWVQAAQVLPTSPANLRHAVIYIVSGVSKWLHNAPAGKPFDASTMARIAADDENWNDADILIVYAPGSRPGKWPAGMAKFIPQNAELIFQMEYAADSTAGANQTSVGLIFSERNPTQRIITLRLANSEFVIPPDTAEYRVDAEGFIPNDATLLSCFPLMHLRGKRFEYNIVNKNQISAVTSQGAPQPPIETLLRVHYDSRWRPSYPFSEPRLLTAGTELQTVAWYDNSQSNPHNPDPNTSVRPGEMPSDEVMASFFDVLVPANANRSSYALRPVTTRQPAD